MPIKNTTSTTTTDEQPRFETNIKNMLDLGTQEQQQPKSETHVVVSIAVFLRRSCWRGGGQWREGSGGNYRSP